MSTSFLSITALFLSSHLIVHSNCFLLHYKYPLRQPRAYESKLLKHGCGVNILRSSNAESASATSASDELDELQNELWLIEAIEARNAAQIYSFVDEAAQWEAQSEEDRAQLLRKPVVVAAIQRLEEAQGAAPKDGNSEAEVAASSGSSQHQDDGDDDANNGSQEVLASIGAVSLLLLGSVPGAVAASDSGAFITAASNRADLAVALVFPLLAYKVAAVARGQQLMWYLDTSIALAVVAVLRAIFQSADLGACHRVLETGFET